MEKQEVYFAKEDYLSFLIIALIAVPISGFLLAMAWAENLDAATSLRYWGFSHLIAMLAALVIILLAGSCAVYALYIFLSKKTALECDHQKVTVRSLSYFAKVEIPYSEIDEVTFSETKFRDLQIVAKDKDFLKSQLFLVSKLMIKQSSPEGKPYVELEASNVSDEQKEELKQWIEQRIE